jgi:myo-inositol-1-phosphate synthase
MTDSAYLDGSYSVRSPNVSYHEDKILSKYNYQSTKVNGSIVETVDEQLVFKTETKVGKVGLMLVGWGGNNGSTVTAGIVANRLGLSWMTKEGRVDSNYFGSVTQSSTVRLGLNAMGESVYIPFKNLLPMVHPNDLVIGGWDISKENLSLSMARAQVLDYDLQRQLAPHMEQMVPLPSIYIPSFIAANQSERANNIIEGTKQQQMEKIRADIRDFKAKNSLDKVIVLWTANTERFSSIEPGINDTADALLAAIKVR